MRGWSFVDALLGLFLLLYALDGIRRGFIAGVLGLAGIVVTLFVALHTFTYAADLIRQYASLPAVVANVAGFFAVLIVAQIVFVVVSRVVLLALMPVRVLLGPLMVLDHLLGVIPGVIQGALLATLVITPLHYFSVSGPVGKAIETSTLATLLTHASARAIPQLSGLVADVMGDAPLFRSRIVGSDETVQIIPQQHSRRDPRAEEEMLVLLNKERTARGLNPMVMDDVLRRVARAHSEEMFRLGYFSHNSPTDLTHTPVDRLFKERYFFITSGENLAFAPTVEAAHAGLMASPGHRSNILTPEFTRVGVGVQDAGLYGRMFTQEFAS